MDWLFVCILALFFAGLGRAIKLYHLSRDVNVLIDNSKFHLLGMVITVIIGGLLYEYAGMPAPRDNWVACLILGIAPFLGLIWGEKMFVFRRRK